MDYREKLIEFLSEPENMKFLLEIEPLITQTKEYKYMKCYNTFIEKFIKPMAKSGS